MKNTISTTDFNFEFAGYGHYKVTYTSPVTGKSWQTTTNNMELIDATKGDYDAKKTDLNQLKKLCKNA